MTRVVRTAATTATALSHVEKTKRVGVGPGGGRGRRGSSTMEGQCYESETRMMPEAHHGRTTAQ
jgi:hypothetical protein